MPIKRTDWPELIQRVLDGESITRVSFDAHCCHKDLGQRIRAHKELIKFKKSPPKILIYDIETLPNKGYFFECWIPDGGQIPLQFIEKERTICTIAYKFLGDKETKVLSASRPYDDRKILYEFLKVWESANYAVAHFGDKFDARFIAGRLLINALPSLPPISQIDTYKLAKKHCKLNSNKLDYLGQILEVGRKNKTEANLWVECAKGNKKAVREMAHYNKQDVDLLEQVFVALLPYVKSKINYNLFLEDKVLHCRSCGSDNLDLKGFELMPESLKHRYKCKDCGAWSSGKVSK